MKKSLIFLLAILFILLNVANIYSQDHVLHNNSSNVLITPIGIITNHPSDITGANKNLSLGKNALPNAPTSAGLNQFNVAIGENALFANNAGSSNIAIGVNALSSNIFGGGNMSIGVNSLKFLSSGAQNIAMGTNTMLNLTTGVGNLVVGNYSMTNATSSYYNVLLGGNINGTATVAGLSAQNAAVGYNSLSELRSGTNNSVLGAFGLYGVVNPSLNVSVGHSAISNYGATNTTQNVVLGNDALSLLSGITPTSSITGNVVIGFEAAKNYPIISNRLIIANSNTQTPLIGGDFAFNKLGIGRNYSLISSDASTFQVGGGGIGINRYAKFSLGLDADNGFSYIQNSGGIGNAGNLVFGTNNADRVQIDSNGKIKINALPIYNDNTTALLGGLTAGYLYKTATGVLMIVF